MTNDTCPLNIRFNLIANIAYKAFCAECPDSHTGRYHTITQYETLQISHFSWTTLLDLESLWVISWTPRKSVNEKPRPCIGNLIANRQSAVLSQNTSITSNAHLEIGQSAPRCLEQFPQQGVHLLLDPFACSPIGSRRSCQGQAQSREPGKQY